MTKQDQDPVGDMIASLRLLAKTTGLGLAETEILRLLVSLSAESRNHIRALAA